MLNCVQNAKHESNSGQLYRCATRNRFSPVLGIFDIYLNLVRLHVEFRVYEAYRKKNIALVL